MPRSGIVLGATTVQLTPAMGGAQVVNKAISGTPNDVREGSVVGGSVTGVRYAWSDYVGCVLQSSQTDIPAAPFSHFFA